MSSLDHAFMRAFKTTTDAVQPKMAAKADSNSHSAANGGSILATTCQIAAFDIQQAAYSLDVGLNWSIPEQPSPKSSAGEPRLPRDTQKLVTGKKPKNRKWQHAFEVDRFALSPACRLFVKNASAVADVIDDLALAKNQDRNVAVIRSWSRGAGRTTLCVALASILSQSGFSVAVLDGDFDNPKLQEALGISVPQGWESVIKGIATASQNAIKSLEDGFTVLPLTSSEINVFESDVLRRIETLVSELSGQFDFVLVDGGPGSQVWDHLNLPDCISNLVVSDQRTTITRDLTDFFEKASHCHHPVVGTINNFSKAA